jgi:hypothetical protein
VAISLAGCGGGDGSDGGGYIAKLRGAVPDLSATPAPTAEPTMTPVPLPTEQPQPEIIAPVETIAPAAPAALTATATAWVIYATVTPPPVQPAPPDAQAASAPCAWRTVTPYDAGGIDPNDVVAGFCD